MIELNLVPDVKQEFIKAQRVRNMVTAGSVLVMLISGGVVVALLMYTFGAQTLMRTLADNGIKSEFGKLSSHEDLGKSLTIQNQLKVLSGMADKKNVDSRLYDILKVISLPEPNTSTFSVITLDNASNKLTLEGQAKSGFAALEVLRETILATKISYKEENSDNSETKNLTEAVTVSDTNYGQDSTGIKVLRFKMEFEFDPILFSPKVSDLAVLSPNTTNATDSAKNVPKSIFGNKATDLPSGENN